MQIPILYEDEYVLALDKPSGLLVHPVKEAGASHRAGPDGKKPELVLTDWLLENYPGLKEVGETQTLQSGKVIKRPGIIHRLDKETSGVILIAKTQEAHQFLKEQFQNRKTEKIYNVMVWDTFSEDKLEGVIDKPIGRNKLGKWSAQDNIEGKTREAVTEYKVLGQNKKFAYLEVRPKTGRTHQIRVHLKSISHPVVCDKLYAPKKNCDGSDACLGFNHLALHALSIKIQLPNGIHIKIESPLPKEFEETRKLLI